MRLIDADRLKRSFEANTPIAFQDCVPGIHSVIDLEPTVEAEPVRHAKWWRYPLHQAGFPDHVFMMRQCSECKKVFDQKWNYCPNCGSKMDMRNEK